MTKQINKGKELAEEIMLGLPCEDHEQHEVAKFEREYKLKNNNNKIRSYRSISSIRNTRTS